MIALLDLDNTLVDRAAGFAAWTRTFVDEWSLSEGDRTWIQQQDRAVERREDFFARLSGRFPHTGTPDELWTAFRARMPALTPAFPGVLAGLGALRSSGWRLAVVTNGRTDNQLGKLRRSGVADAVDAWCVSEEAGLRKPDPAIFALTLARLGATGADGCWVVGDDPAADIAGGQAAGLRTLWVSHARSWPRSDLRPDRVAVTPGDALRLLSDPAAR